MKKAILLSVLGAILVGGGVAVLKAGVHKRGAVVSVALQTTTPTIGPVSATPNLVTVNTPTAVVVTALITDPNVIPTGVNLLRLNATGNPPTVLGVMRDDGTNGDATANDKTFTLRMNFNEARAGEIRLQVSAAFRGILRRAISTVVVVAVGTKFVAPTLGISFVLPPQWVTSVSDTPTSNDPTPTTVVATSPSGSHLLILPDGGEGFGLTDNVGENRQSVNVSMYTATRREFYYADGEIFLVTIAVHAVPNRPAFRIDMQPQIRTDVALMDAIVATITAR